MNLGTPVQNKFSPQTRNTKTIPRPLFRMTPTRPAALATSSPRVVSSPSSSSPLAASPSLSDESPIAALMGFTTSLLPVTTLPLVAPACPTSRPSASPKKRSHPSKDDVGARTAETVAQRESMPAVASATLSAPARAPPPKKQRHEVGVEARAAETVAQGEIEPVAPPVRWPPLNASFAPLNASFAPLNASFAPPTPVFATGNPSFDPDTISFARPTTLSASAQAPQPPRRQTRATRQRFIATDANSIRSLSSIHQNPPFCCSLHEPMALGVLTTHRAWINLTRQAPIPQVFLKFPDGIERFLSQVPRIVQVITVMVGSYQHYTRYFWQTLNADGASIRWVELLGLVDAEMHVAGFMPTVGQNLEYSCAREGHGTFKYLINFWVKEGALPGSANGGLANLGGMV